MLECCGVIFFDFSPVLLIVIEFNLFTCEIFRVENNIAAVIGILYLLYSLFLALSINADYLV